MGTTTPNIGIYAPSAGETNYEQAFTAGMVNVDQHDHSGGPNKGLPIATEGLGDFSVTFDKLNANVVDPDTGVGTSSTFKNQIVLLDPIKNIFQLAPANGFIVMDGVLAHVRTFQDSASVTWTNPTGAGGNPSASVNIAGISPVPVANGGTGLTSLASWDIMCGGTTPTGNVQQVSGEGTSGQFLGSNGAGDLPTWKSLPVVTQNFLVATATLDASQVRNLLASPYELIPAQGAGTVIVVHSLNGKLTYGGSDAFHDGSGVRLYWGGSSDEVGFGFTSGTFKGTVSGYYYADNQQSSSSTPVSPSVVENRRVTISMNSGAFTGGNGNTVSFYCTYSIMQI